MRTHLDPTSLTGGTDTEDVSAGALAGQRPREFRGIYDLNEWIVGDADDPYAIVLRVEQYVRSAYSWSLSPPVSRYRSPYAAFLFCTCEGFCQHFAGAAALLLRLNGVAARVAVGFVTGQEMGPRTYQVTTNNAHSWAEAYFPGVGWVPFEPTPGRFQGVPVLPRTAPTLSVRSPTQPIQAPMAPRLQAQRAET